MKVPRRLKQIFWNRKSNSLTTTTPKNDFNLREIKTVPQVDRSTHKPTPVGGEDREYF